MLTALAFSTTVLNLALEFTSPPDLAATIISLIILVNEAPLFESVRAFLRLIVAHFECPDMKSSVLFFYYGSYLRLFARFKPVHSSMFFSLVCLDFPFVSFLSASHLLPPSFLSCILFTLISYRRMIDRFSKSGIRHSLSYAFIWSRLTCTQVASASATSTPSRSR